jgi:hypothetical protein
MLNSIQSEFFPFSTKLNELGKSSAGNDCYRCGENGVQEIGELPAALGGHMKVRTVVRLLERARCHLCRNMVALA